MKLRKNWLYGPFKSDFPTANPIHFQPPIEKPILLNKTIPVNKTSTEIKNISYRKKEVNYDKLPPWRDACVKSHELFILETKKLTII